MTGIESTFSSEERHSPVADEVPCARTVLLESRSASAAKKVWVRILVAEDEGRLG